MIELHKTKILITGGTGYLGSNLLNQLSLKYSQILDLNIIDRHLKTENLVSISNWNFYEYDLQNPLSHSLETLIKESSLIIHTAFLNDLNKEKNLIQKFSEINPKSMFVFFSSAAVYGDTSIHGDSGADERSHCNPINSYGRYKLELEKYIQESFGEALILRIANPYGKEIKTRGFYQIVIKKLKEQSEAPKISIPLNADFKNQIIRDFIYIDEATKQIITTLETNTHGILNISTGQGLSLESFVHKIAKLESIDPERIEFEYRGAEESEIKQSILKNTLCEASLLNSSNK